MGTKLKKKTSQTCKKCYVW